MLKCIEILDGVVSFKVKEKKVFLKKKNGIQRNKRTDEKELRLVRINENKEEINK